MDRSIYVGMTGAAQLLSAQAEIANNLANASTVGYKAATSAFRSLPVLGEGEPTRINAVDHSTGYDFTQGTMVHTGRPLDVAVQGPGWMAVESPNGGVGYTRAGDLQIAADGTLTDAAGDPVMGNNGPISIPQASSIHIGADGSVSIVPLGEQPLALASVGQIMLVNPPADQLQAGGDGLMHLKNGGSAPPDAAVHLVSGELENSNVNAALALVKMVSMSRQFELQVHAIQTADQNAKSATQLLQP